MEAGDDYRPARAMNDGQISSMGHQVQQVE